MEHVETFQLTDTSRIVVDYDEYVGYDCPLDWEDEIFFHILREPYLSHSTLSRDTVPWTVPVREIEDYDDDVGAALVKHFHRKGWAASVESWTGYSQGDWLEYVIAAPDNALPSIVETLNQWLSGDVYVISVEERVTWRNDAGETRETWEVIDSVGGVYLEHWNDATILSEVAGLMGNDWMEGKESR